ncbi:MAG: tetratricopeptide repeat protein, partial [Xanthomonadales bacterium]|nr:tetratricopeptide repeat protein [Xanthomonadales bacterium]
LMHNDLAVLYGDQHRLGEAEREQQSALDILRRRMQGKPFPAIAIGIGNLGFLRMQRGNLKGAMDAFDSAESMFAQMPDREFAEKAIVLYNRSVVHTVNGEYAQADADARQAVQIAEKQYGRDHPLLATILARRIETAVD